MIHDLDIILALVQVGASCRSRRSACPVLTPKFDIANARLRFASGCIANVTASRISRDRVRKIRFFQPDAYLSIDYAAQEVEGWRLVRRDGQRPEIQGGQLPVTRDEPLRRELADFVGAVRDSAAPRRRRAGRRALALATGSRTRWRACDRRCELGSRSGRVAAWIAIDRPSEQLIGRDR